VTDGAGDKKKQSTTREVSAEELRRLREQGREALQRTRERLKRMTEVEESSLRHRVR
jgi:ElaB/YqjD/DUF883 family membrane-anchored ribosome-binding protein